MRIEVADFDATTCPAQEYFKYEWTWLPSFDDGALSTVTRGEHFTIANPRVPGLPYRVRMTALDADKAPLGVGDVVEHVVGYSFIPEGSSIEDAAFCMPSHSNLGLRVALATEDLQAEIASADDWEEQVRGDLAAFMGTQKDHIINVYVEDSHRYLWLSLLPGTGGENVIDPSLKVERLRNAMRMNSMDDGMILKKTSLRSIVHIMVLLPCFAKSDGCDSSAFSTLLGEVGEKSHFETGETCLDRFPGQSGDDNAMPDNTFAIIGILGFLALMAYLFINRNAQPVPAMSSVGGNFMGVTQPSSSSRSQQKAQRRAKRSNFDPLGLDDSDDDVNLSLDMENGDGGIEMTPSARTKTKHAPKGGSAHSRSKYSGIVASEESSYSRAKDTLANTSVVLPKPGKKKKKKRAEKKKKLAIVKAEAAHDEEADEVDPIDDLLGLGISTAKRSNSVAASTPEEVEEDAQSWSGLELDDTQVPSNSDEGL
jgi:hypothetical protein